MKSEEWFFTVISMAIPVNRMYSCTAAITRSNQRSAGSFRWSSLKSTRSSILITASLVFRSQKILQLGYHFTKSWRAVRTSSRWRAPSRELTLVSTRVSMSLRSILRASVKICAEHCWSTTISWFQTRSKNTSKTPKIWMKTLIIEMRLQMS